MSPFPAYSDNIILQKHSKFKILRIYEAGDIAPRAAYLFDGFTNSVTTRMTAAVIPRLRGYTCMIVVKDGDF